jgi:hypothetical protein
MCSELIPVYYGERGIATVGKPGTGKDYLYICYHSADINGPPYRKANTIGDLCNECKKYNPVKPLTKEEIREKFYK